MIKFHSLPGLSYTRTIKFFSLRPVSAQGDFSWERDTLSWPVHISKVPLYAFKALGRGVQTAAVPQDGFSHVAPAQHLPAAARKAAGMREFMERKPSPQQPLRSLLRMAVSGLQWLMWCWSWHKWWEGGPLRTFTINKWKMPLHQTHYHYEKSRSNYTRNPAIEPLLDDWQRYFF